MKLFLLFLLVSGVLSKSVTYKDPVKIVAGPFDECYKLGFRYTLFIWCILSNINFISKRITVYEPDHNVKTTDDDNVKTYVFDEQRKTYA